ncbi:unnamed protein product [Amoebophrya sp. A120]|nr:unnamed protein product [Amoebophrya sp. A120]|eukprot:GSA120T00019300001.1
MKRSKSEDYAKSTKATRKKPHRLILLCVCFIALPHTNHARCHGSLMQKGWSQSVSVLKQLLRVGKILRKLLLTN